MAARSLATALGRRNAFVAVLAGLALCALLATPGATFADTEPPPTLTFAGPAGGGTIRLTTTADRNSVLRAEVIDVAFPGCGTESALIYFDPPAAVTGGAFEFSFLASGPPTFATLRLSGAFVSETSIAGTAIRDKFARPTGPICRSPEVAWKLTGPVETPPGPADIVYLGSAKSGAGTILLTTDPSRSGITSLTVSGLSAPPCTGDDPVDVIAFFDPPLAIDAAGGSFETFLETDQDPVLPQRGFFFRGTLLSADRLTGTIEFFDNPITCTAEVAWNALRKGVPVPPRMQKLPPLQNLFLTRQGVKIPPVRCLDGTDVATLTESISLPLTSTDPKDPSQPQRLGGFSFQVKYDPLKVCVVLRPGPAWTDTGQVCTIEDSLTAPTLQGVARINCVTLGKSTVVDTSTEAGRTLALIEVRPQPEAYSQIKPGQDNGQAVQINDEKCKLTDLQGHAIEVFSCEDADLTIRYLEGDIEPDCQVNTLDTQAVGFRWGATKGNLAYNDRFNLEPSGTLADQDIDVNDLQFVYGRFGSTCDAPWPDQPPVNPKA